MKIYDGTSQPTAGETEAGAAPASRIPVGIAEYAVNTDGAVLSTSGLGSCVGVALFDPTTGVTGLVHVMLPSAEDGVETSSRAKFADTGIETLLDEMVAEGADPGQIQAKLAGGSEMLDFSGPDGSIGPRNVNAAVTSLERLGIPLVGRDVGGDFGRSLEFKPHSGDLLVKTARGKNHKI